MKIDVNPDVLRQIAAYCDEQSAAMQATRDYLNDFGTLSSLQTGLLLSFLNPFYDLCRNVTMTGFSAGQKLVKSRAEAIHDYIEEQSAMETSNTSVWDGISGALALGTPLGNPGIAGNAGNAGGMGSPFSGAQHGEQELNPQPLPPGPPDAQVQHGEQELNPQPLPPGPSDGQLQHVEQELNPQPLPPGPSDAGHLEAMSDRKEVMDQVWQERSKEDQLGRSPQQLQSLWEARQPVGPSMGDASGMESQQMQSTMDRQAKFLETTSNMMQLVSNTQLTMLSNVKSS